MSDTTEHHFGGDWTEQKLEALKRYLQAYTTALKNKPFRLLYIDSFAGTGYRHPKSTEDHEQEVLLEDIGEEAADFLDGSARLALKSEPPFDCYVFIEKRAEHVAELEKLRKEFDDRQIRIRHGDANEKVREICRQGDWDEWRAVCFLDPYGMQVEWSTLKAISDTEAIDVWLLVPMGAALNRMLPHSGDVPEGWQKRLDVFFGTEEWRDAVYTEEPKAQAGLFDENESEKSTARESLEGIEQYFINRLQELFPAVQEKPLRLCKPNGRWLYSLYFAVSSSDKAAQGLALRIANHITKLVQEQ